MCFRPRGDLALQQGDNQQIFLGCDVTGLADRLSKTNHPWPHTMCDQCSVANLPLDPATLLRSEIRFSTPEPTLITILPIDPSLGHPFPSQYFPSIPLMILLVIHLMQKFLILANFPCPRFRIGPGNHPNQPNHRHLRLHQPCPSAACGSEFLNLPSYEFFVRQHEHSWRVQQNHQNHQ